MGESMPILERVRVRANSSSAHPSVLSRRPAGRRLFPFRLSIRDKILLALLVVVVLMSVPYVFLIVPGMQYMAQYDALIQNITAANSINGYIKPWIDAEMWDIIAGKKPFSQGNQY